ncbi:uncharacterized protein NECHADRAFT_99315 [Fusarium vanettenii 77-13-4]|uniref:Uncharacterized protein n=1 Tax=Fusarium vanettenii (strain ATCC MYA-4622 / CBS 123669 / FGSC 9596 / NRRL 45880 / 77-13-4) TaxID=660122 RepID=C7Z4X6_FUSV7|nr:uncharacterized protein NECHADRAFT_99315 [Fusarium vanettenii 77-13-4]EEU40423.1 predicted protein [Fusarium vanettenii 77-13-4]
MPKKKSSVTKLTSLYDALEIPQEGELPCLGHIAFNIACTFNQRIGTDGIEPILLELISATKDGAATDSAEAQGLLRRLAIWLTCPSSQHDHHVRHNDHVYDKYQYVAFVLGERLMSWDGGADSETPERTRSTRLAVPDFSLTRRHKHIESSDDEGEELEDEYEDYDGGGEDSEENEEVSKVSTDESTMSRRQRPKPEREGPMINQPAAVTPIKQRGRPTSNSRASTPTMGHLVNGLDSLSVIDDASIMSPESTISPGPSEIFSPISTASTPMSIPDSEVRPRRSRYLRGEDESPTRRQRHSTGDDYLGDAMRRMRGSLKKGGQLEKSLLLRNQTSESERSTDDEEVEEQPTSKSKKASPRLLKVGNMRFAPASEDKKNAVQLVLKRLRQAPMGQSLSPGWVYCFAEKTAPGYLKIGSKISKGSNDDTTLSLEDQKNDAEVRKRLQTKTGHREWFEISEDDAREAVEVWEQFSNLMPYNDKGQLEKFWFDYATDKYKSFVGWPPEEWLYECWATLTGPAAVNHRKQISKLERKETELTERRRQTEERKKELEHEIQSLKQEEKEIRRQLAQLQGQQ